MRRGLRSGVHVEQGAQIVADRQESMPFLVRWLSLLGWRVSLAEGDRVEAVAEHVTDQGVVLHVEASAESTADAGWLLFERAVAALEAQRPAAA